MPKAEEQKHELTTLSSQDAEDFMQPQGTIQSSYASPLGITQYTHTQPPGLTTGEVLSLLSA